MAAVPIQIDGVLWNQAWKTAQKVTLMGNAFIMGLSVGGGPIIPPDTSPPDGGPPDGPPDQPPSTPTEGKPPPEAGGWGWVPDWGWGYFPNPGGKPSPIQPPTEPPPPQ
jgi:hypothetical protein